MQNCFRKAEIEIKSFIEQIIDLTFDQSFSNHAVQLCQSKVAKDVICTEYQSLEQINFGFPQKCFLRSDNSNQRKIILDSFRPLSACINKVSYSKQKKKPSIHESNRKIRYKKLISECNIARRQRDSRISKTYIQINGAKDKKQRKHAFSKSTTEQHLIALNTNDEDADQYDRTISKLREIKAEVEQYQRNKENFMMGIDREKSQYSKEQKKLASNLGRKEFTYSFNGAIIEIPKVKAPIKKKTRNVQLIRTGNKKSQNTEEKCEQIMVRYSKNDSRREKVRTILGKSEGEQIGKLIKSQKSKINFSILADNY